MLEAITATVDDRLRWHGTLEEYCRIVAEHPKTTQTAHQRMFAAISHYGSRSYMRFRENATRWLVFDDPFTPDHKNAVYGDNVDQALMQLVNTLRAAASGLGQEHRMYLLKGPVGTAKSTAVNLLAAALEHYTATDEGRLYAPYWQVEDSDEEGRYILGTASQRFEATQRDCPVHEEPLAVLPIEIRDVVVRELERSINAALPSDATRVRLQVPPDPCPYCAGVFRRFLARERNDWHATVEKYLRIKRIVLSAADGVGIVFVRPRDSKDQDATEFHGDTILNALAMYGSSSDERTFDFQGYYQRSMRGMLYWEEMLKFGVSFLYDLLGVSMEHRIQPPRFRQIHYDGVLIGSTNEFEFSTKLEDNEAMQALRDRTICVQLPYVLGVSDEVKIYEKFFTPDRRGGKHLAPHTIYLAALWAVLTRIKDPQKATGLDRLKKARLYDGGHVRGHNEDSVRQLVDEAGVDEGATEAISPRFIGDKISAAFMASDNKGCVNPFLVAATLRSGLKVAFKSGKKKGRLEEYEKLLEVALTALHDLLKEDLQAAIVGDEQQISDLWTKYVDESYAILNDRKVIDRVTGEPRKPDDEFLRRIEDLIEIRNHEEFRQRLSNAMADRAHQRSKDSSVPAYDFRADHDLHNALRLYLFEQAKERLNWETLISRKATDASDQRRVDDIKQRLISGHGYCDVCASEVMVHIAAIFRRGERNSDKQ